MKTLTRTTGNIKSEYYRKAIHLSSLWIPLFIYTQDHIFSAAFLLCLCALDFFIEYLSFRHTGNLDHVIKKNLIKTMRYDEIQKNTFHLSGAFFVLVSAFCCTIIFSREVACLSLCVMILSDAAAALVGKYHGKIKISEHKTLEGSLAFFIMAMIVSGIYCGLTPLLIKGLAAASVSTLTELYAKKIKLDDNFLIPLVYGFVFSL